MEFVITDEMKAFEKALNGLGINAHYENYFCYCTDDKIHCGTRIIVFQDDYNAVSFIFTPDGRRVNSWLECPDAYAVKKLMQTA